MLISFLKFNTNLFLSFFIRAWITDCFLTKRLLPPPPPPNHILNFLSPPGCLREAKGGVEMQQINNPCLFFTCRSRTKVYFAPCNIGFKEIIQVQLFLMWEGKFHPEYSFYITIFYIKKSRRTLVFFCIRSSYLFYLFIYFYFSLERLFSFSLKS